MTVNEGYIFSNTGKTTYHDPDAGTLRFYLPPAAKGIVQVSATAPNGMPVQRPADKNRQGGRLQGGLPHQAGRDALRADLHRSRMRKARRSRAR